MHVTAVKFVSRERRQFEKGGAGINQEIDAFARQHFTASRMALPRSLTAATGYSIEFGTKFGDQRPHRLGIARKVG
jgi:hypothetical protein